MSDFDFVSMKMQSFFGVKFSKNSFFQIYKTFCKKSKKKTFFINAVLKVFWTFFYKMFCMFGFCFIFFCFVQKDGSLSRMTRCLFYVSNAEQWNGFVFLLIWFLTFKNQEFLFWCSLLWVHFLWILICIILALSLHLHLYSFYYFCYIAC